MYTLVLLADQVMSSMYIHFANIYGPTEGLSLQGQMICSFSNLIVQYILIKCIVHQPAMFTEFLIREQADITVFGYRTNYETVCHTFPSVLIALF